MTLLFKSIDGKTYTLANVRGPKGTLIVAVLGVTPPRTWSCQSRSQAPWPYQLAASLLRPRNTNV